MYVRVEFVVDDLGVFDLCGWEGGKWNGGIWMVGYGMDGGKCLELGRGGFK